MNLPKELTELKQWVCWRLEKDKNGRDIKIPYNPETGKKASSSNPATWRSYAEAEYAKEKYFLGQDHFFSGVGFVFTAECGIIGIDIDHCLVDGKLNSRPSDVAAAILAKLPPTYIEISPSGEGLHIFLKGNMPSSGRRNNKYGVEMYSSGRYFTVTGNRWYNCADEIAEDNGAGKIAEDDSTDQTAEDNSTGEIAEDNGVIEFIHRGLEILLTWFLDIPAEKPSRPGNGIDIGVRGQAGSGPSWCGSEPAGPSWCGPKPAGPERTE